MKRTRNEFRKGGASSAKQLALALVLIAACALMTACYMEPDRVVDAGNALDNSGNQNFQTVITDTPAPTDTPTPGAYFSRRTADGLVGLDLRRR